MTTPIVPSITDEQLEELEKLCSKVAQGPRRIEWDEDSCAGAIFVCSGLAMYSGGQICRTYSEDDADLIVATGPEDILGLIARLRAAEKDAARYRFIRSEYTRPGFLSSDPSKAKWLDEYLVSGEKMDAKIDLEMERDQ